jgi:hypothetical protein
VAHLVSVIQHVKDGNHAVVECTVRARPGRLITFRVVRSKWGLCGGRFCMALCRALGGRFPSGSANLPARAGESGGRMGRALQLALRGLRLVALRQLVQPRRRH